MTCPCVLPNSLPIECLMELISIARNGDAFSKRATVMSHAGCFMLGLSALLKDDATVIGNTEVEINFDSTEDLCDYIEENVQLLSAESTSAMTADGVGLDLSTIQLIMQIVKLIAELISSLRK